MSNTRSGNSKKRPSSKRKALASTTTSDNSGMIRMYSNSRVPSVKRIQTPHAHDVLSGRGGGINSHIGNQTFREWVKERKEEYNLAPSKAEKAKIALEVMNRVKELDPPGRFLQRDPDCPSNLNAWVEVDETRAIAKTSQALREGAPKIRAAHRDEIEQRAKKAKQRSASKRKAMTNKTKSASSAKNTSSIIPPPLPAPVTTIHADPLSISAGSAIHESDPTVSTGFMFQNDVESAFEPPTKRVRAADRPTQHNLQLAPTRTSSTPPLVPLPPPPIPVPQLMPNVTPGGRAASYPNGLSEPTQNGMKRSHSLTLSDLSVGDFSGGEEFVDPFADESVLLARINVSPKPPTPRSLRNISNGEAEHSPRNGTRQRSNGLSWSSRSTTELSDLADTAYQQSFLGSTDFGEGMKLVYDAVHPDLTSPDKEDIIPTHLIPWRGLRQ